MLPRQNLKAIEAVGANLRPFSLGGSVGQLRESPTLVNLYMERKPFTVQPINWPMDHTGET